MTMATEILNCIFMLDAPQEWTHIYNTGQYEPIFFYKIFEPNLVPHKSVHLYNFIALIKYI
jgi:hypothetical protein